MRLAEVKQQWDAMPDFHEPPNQKIVARKRGRPAKATITRQIMETVNVRVEGQHELQRQIRIIVPGNPQATQLILSPALACAVWSGLSIEQRYELMDVDGLWDGFDDDMKMVTVSKVMLVHPERP